MWGVVPTSFGFKSEGTDLGKSNIVENACYSSDKNIFHRAERHVENLPVQSHLLMCLASCHSLTLIDNELIGDPLDIKMFQSTNWDLEDASGTLPNSSVCISPAGP